MVGAPTASATAIASSHTGDGFPVRTRDHELLPECREHLGPRFGRRIGGDELHGAAHVRDRVVGVAPQHPQVAADPLLHEPRHHGIHCFVDLDDA